MTGSRSSSIGAVIATIAALVTLLLTFGALALTVLNLGDGAVFDADAGQGLAGVTLGASFAVVGWLVAARRPDNPLGWLYLGIGLSQVGDSFLKLAAIRGLVLSPGSIPAADLWSWLAVIGWVPGYVLLLTFALLLFPTGHLPSRRWRPVAWLAVISLLLLSVPMGVASWPLRGAALLAEDLGAPPEWASSLQLVGLAALLVVAIASTASIVVRWRRSAGLERQQLKWFAWASVPVLAILATAAFVTFPPPAWILVAAFVSPLLPIAIGIAILRYRLYEIDRIVSRTIGWALVTGLLVAVFAIAVVALQTALSGITQGQTLAVAASTLVAFALFQPVRRRVQRAVDRRFDRARYDADRTATTFAERLRDEVDIETVTADLSGTTHATLAPTTLSIWLRRP